MLSKENNNALGQSGPGSNINKGIIAHSQRFQTSSVILTACQHILGFIMSWG